ncbi:MAG: hypothetical protein QM759_10250 [Terricaulis sp.]
MSKTIVLGDLLAFSRTSSNDMQAWLTKADPVLAAKIHDQAAVRGETLVQFVRIAVADFLAEADEETWASPMSAVRDAVDPGAACLARMTDFRIAMEIAA